MALVGAMMFMNKQSSEVVFRVGSLFVPRHESPTLFVRYTELSSCSWEAQANLVSWLYLVVDFRILKRHESEVADGC